MRKRLLSLYPDAWRERYGAEMAALLDDSPPSVSATVDLLRGALMAHLRPLVGALIAGAALVLAAVPLIVASLAQARRTRDPSLIKLIAIPPVAIAVFAGSVGLLALWLNAHHHRAGVGGWLLLALCAVSHVVGGHASRIEEALPRRCSYACDTSPQPSRRRGK